MTTQLEHCTDLLAFLAEYNAKYPAEECVEIIAYPMVKGDGAPQYTFFADSDKPTQLALL